MSNLSFHVRQVTACARVSAILVSWGRIDHIHCSDGAAVLPGSHFVKFVFTLCVSMCCICV